MLLIPAFAVDRTEIVLWHQELFPSIDLTETRTTDRSKALNSRRGPMIIISASGMATGGRIIHHLANRIGDHRNEVLLVGFQAPGMRGDALRSGARRPKMFGRYHPVRARVSAISLSSHADRTELIDWIETTTPAPEVVYVNHDEPDAAAALVDKIEAHGVMAVAPRPGERVRVDRRSSSR